MNTGLYRDATVDKINNLMDEEKWGSALRLAQLSRDAATDPRARRRFHGLWLFAQARVPKASAGRFATA